MISLRDIKNDFKRGDYIDLYVTLLLSLCFVAANIIFQALKIKVDFDLTSLNISVLFMMAIVLLKNRRKLDAIRHDISKISESGIAEAFPASYVDDIRNAKELIQTGIHLSSNLNEYFVYYREMLEKGGKLKIVMVDPKGSAIDMAAMRFPGNIDPEREKVRAYSSLKILDQLMAEFSNIEVRLIDYLFAYSAVLVNQDSLDSKLYTERYTFRILGGARKPKHVFTRGDGRWYELYKHEIIEIWNIAKPYFSK